MEEELPQEPSKTTPPVNYAEKLAGQQALVDRLSADFEKNPSPQLELELKQKKDALRHLQNLIKEDPKGRAQAAAEKARLSALSKAYA